MANVTRFRSELHPGFYCCDTSMPKIENHMQNSKTGGELIGCWDNLPQKQITVLNENGLPDPTSSGTSICIEEPIIAEFQPPYLGSECGQTKGNLTVSPSSTWPSRLLLDESALSYHYVSADGDIKNRGLLLSLSIPQFEARSTVALDLSEAASCNTTEFCSRSQCNHENHNMASVVPTYQQLRQSTFLRPAQQLLLEFCDCNVKMMRRPAAAPPIEKNRQRRDLFLEGSLSTVDHPELRTRMAKLLSMVEEVERTYSQYCAQTRALLSSFEEVMGPGSAAVYSSSAATAMSRHFRCLRDGILSYIRAILNILSEKECAGMRSSRGETPRLKILDQTLRQQKIFEQVGGVESHPWRPQRGLPERAVSILRAWLFEHFLHPYPSDVDKHILARQTGLSRSQVSNWFINARVRLWKPMVEEMYLEETKGESRFSEFALLAADGGPIAL